jgi:hypothetical protein
VEIRRNGALLARGTGLSVSGAAGSDTLRVELVSPDAKQKN